MQVTPENVLQVHNAIKAEAEYLRGQLLGVGYSLRVGKPGLEQVSDFAASDQGFNGKIRTLLEQCQTYARILSDAADRLAKTAAGYGHSEQEIVDSFRKFSASFGEQSASPLPATSGTHS